MTGRIRGAGGSGGKVGEAGEAVAAVDAGAVTVEDEAGAVSEGCGE
nr:hypothetical protein HUO10_006227 [Paraburkholderia busanensis]